MLSLKDVEKVYNRLEGVVKRTPLEYNKNLSKRYQSEIYLKREDLQLTRSYKVRGAYNVISQIKGSSEVEIVCASAGNHAQGVAFSTNRVGRRGKIFMPVSTPLQKVEKVKEFGNGSIEIILRGNDFDETYQIAKGYCNLNSSIFVHPFDDLEIIKGQATVGREIIDQLDKFDMVIIPVGGGGLAAGVGSYLRSYDQTIDIVTAEPLGAPSLIRSLENNSVTRLENIDTFVDGAAVKAIGELNFKLLKDIIGRSIVVDEGLISTTILNLYNSEGMIVEPAGALSIAALDQLRDLIRGKRVVSIVSGGNNDIYRFPEIMKRATQYNKDMVHC